MALDLDIVGSGPPVIFVHGVGLDREMWAGVTGLLADTCTCISFDMPGHGRAATPSGPVSVSTYADALGDVVASCAPDRPAVVGYSMGAMTALHFAGRNPDAVSKLVLMNAVHDRDEAQSGSVRARLETAKREGPQSLIEVALLRWFSADFAEKNPEAIQRVRDRLQRNDPNGFLKAYQVFATADKELLPLLGNITCPAFALTAERDANSTPEMSHNLALALPNGQSAVLEGLAHGAPIEAPARVADELRRFLLSEYVT